MNGILVVDKPEGFTSHDVVAKLRGICGTKKIGHGGTLDPMATGVLPVFIGRAVKAVDLAPNQNKAYSAQILFGIATDTADITGQVLQRADVDIKKNELKAVLPNFLGEQLQTPPMYSAVKIAGKPLYKYARSGQNLQREKRPISILEIDVLDIPAEKNRFWLHVFCSKGTYVRTLAEDIGKALGVPATLSALRRTKAGIFTQEQAHNFKQIQAAKDGGHLEDLLLPTQMLFSHLPEVRLEEKDALRLYNGAPVYRVNAPLGQCRMLQAGIFLGLGTVDAQHSLRADKIFDRG